MAGTIKGITIEINGDTTKLNQSLKSVNQASKDLNKELRNINNSMKFNPKNIELMTQKQRVLAESIKNTKEKLDQLKDAQKQAKDQLASGKIDQGQYDALTREIIKTENQLKKLEGQLKSVNSSWSKHGQVLQETGKKISAMGDKVGEVGKNLTMKVTAPIVGLGTVFTKLGVDFESAMTGVAKTVDMTEEEFQQMSQAIRDMAKEIPATTTEIAAVAEAAGQLGIEKENILGFTRTMIDLGEATNLTADQAATAFARFANITQLPQDQFDRLGSTVVELGNNFATTEAEIVEMGMRLAGTGAQIGLTQAEIMGLATAMSSVGIKAEAGGTAMSTVLNKINNAASGTGQVMEDIEYAAYEAGVSVETFVAAITSGSSGIDAFSKKTGYNKDVMKELAKSYKDSVIPLEGFADVAEKGGMAAEDFAMKWKNEPTAVLEAFVKGLAKIKEEGGNVNLTLKDLGITGVRETDTINRLVNAADLLPDAFDTANRAFEENSALSDEAAKRYETLQAKMDILKNKLKDVGIAFGEILMPYVEQAVEFLGQLAEKISAMDPEMQKLIVTIAAIAAVVGPLLLVVGGIVKAVGTAVKVVGAAMVGLGKIAPLLGVVKGAIVAVAAALGLPVGAVVAIIAIVAALATAVVKNWDTIKSKTESVWNGIKSFLESLWNGLKSKADSIFNSIKDAVSKAWEGIKSKTESVWNGIKSFIEPIWNWIKSTAETVFNTVKSTIEKVWNGIKSTTESIWNGIKSFLEGLWNGVKSTAESVFNGIKSSIENIWNGIKTVTTSTWNAVKEAISKPINAAKDAVSRAVERMKSILNITLPFPKIKLPHFKMSGKFSLNPPSVPSFSVDWYDKGGIFKNPTVIGVGEKRPEFVGALDDLRYLIGDELDKRADSKKGDILVTGNTFVVREEADIKKIAKEIYKLQQVEARRKGLVTV